MGDRVESGSECLERARLGVSWLLEEQSEDGGWKYLPDAPFDAFYRAGWTLGLLGEVAAAERSLNYVKQHLMTPEGDFAPRLDLWHNSVHYSYASAILILGAHRLGRYDISKPGLRFLLSQQDPSQGGFYMVRTEPGRRSPCNTKSSAMAGIASLATGEMEAAEKVAEWLWQVIEMQPEPNSRFYTTTKPGGQLRIDFAPEETAWHLVDTRKEKQCWYAVGLPFAFAVQIHEATGNQRYADLAQWLFDFQMRCVDPWDGPSSGKGAWASSMMYRITGDRKYREIALHVANNFASRQMPERWFKGWLYVQPAPGAPTRTVRQFETTNEFSLWLALIGENLLARDAS